MASNIAKREPLIANGAVFDKRGYWQQKWKENVGYGRRWLVESFFSAFKRRFGEHVCSRRWKSVRNEIRLKAMLYNRLIG